jgi:hypothetical protein
MIVLTVLASENPDGSSIFSSALSGKENEK